MCTLPVWDLLWLCALRAAPGKTPAEGVLAHMLPGVSVTHCELTVCAFFSPLQAHSLTQRGVRDTGNLGFAVTIIVKSDFFSEIPPSNSAHVSWWSSSSLNSDSSPVYSPNRWVWQLFVLPGCECSPKPVVQLRLGGCSLSAKPLRPPWPLFTHGGGQFISGFVRPMVHLCVTYRHQ